MNKLQHWQLFGIMLAPFFISLYINHEYYNGLVKSLSIVFAIFYYLTIGEFLNDTVAKKLKGHNFFRFNCIYLVTTTIIINAGGTEIVGNNLVIMMTIFIYFLVAFLQVVDHVAILLRIAEKKEVDNYKQRYEFILFFILPFGIWTLQPRINKLV